MKDEDYYALLIQEKPIGRLKLMARYRKFDFFCFVATPFLLLAVFARLLGWW